MVSEVLEKGGDLDKEVTKKILMVQNSEDYRAKPL